MQVLVTGLHRSGTSAAARLLAAVTGMRLTDDPQWAIFHPRMASAYREQPEYRRGLMLSEIVKCPRMAECLRACLNDFPTTRAIYLVRDPRDVYCSIQEALAASHWTACTMADNARFGPHTDLWEGVALAFKAYAKEALAARDTFGARLTFLAYADLAADPEHMMGTVCRFLGLSAVHPFPIHLCSVQLAPLRNKAPNDTSIKGPGRWREELSRDLAHKIRKACSDEITALQKLCLPR